MPEPATVAYVLKGFPRISETFIASEIYRLERLGVRLRLLVLKPADEPEHHPVVDRIRAVPEYLPATTSLTASRALPWLAGNIRAFRPALSAVARRRPRGLARAGGLAFAQAVRARRRPLSAPRKIYLKEFLYAVAVAERVLDAPEVRHLHAHFAHGSATVAWLAATITGLPFSFTGHAKDIYSGELNPAGLLARKATAARFVVTCTRANGRHLEALHTGTPVHVVYHGLSADFADLTAAPVERAPSPHLRVLGVGRLVPKKGFDTFVEACARLRAAGVPFEAVIAGEPGEHEPAVRRLVAELGLTGCVSLLGPLGPARLAEEYRRASVFSLACRVVAGGDRDGIPNVLLEAMACGTPVVTTRVSGIPELVEDGVNGLLVSPDDPAALAAAWERVWTDRALADRLARAGRASVLDRFDGDRLVAALAGLLTGAAPVAPVRPVLERR
jgi:glycosyltransferase involved in cell wall biosynthesis